METTATKRKATPAPKKDSGAAAQGASKKASSQKKASPSSTLRLTQIRSFFGILPNQQACLIGLGLRKIHSTSVVQDTPAVRGMITKVRHLIRVEDGAVCN